MKSLNFFCSKQFDTFPTPQPTSPPPSPFPYPFSPVPPFSDSAVPQTTSLLVARLGNWEGDASGRAGATSLVSRLLAKLA